MSAAKGMMVAVTDDELREALDGLYAYDTGSKDSGIRDEALRTRCIDELRSRASDGGDRLWMSRLVRDMWLSEEALAQGYEVADLVEFVRWLDDRMDYTI